MPNDLISNDPIVVRNFYLELDNIKMVLSGVQGFDIEMEVVQTSQNGPGGKQQHVKTLGGVLKAPELTVTRMAPLESKKDPIWIWFLKIRNSGMKASNRTDHRKSGSVVFYDGAWDETARFNFYGGWPSKIQTDSVSTESNEPMKENITFQCERIERVK